MDWEPQNIYSWLLKLVGLLGFLALCLWLTLRPKEPSCTIMDFSIPNPNNTHTNQSGPFYYLLELENPNKDSTVYYDDISLVFFYGEDIVGTDRMDAFKQGKQKKTPMVRVWRNLVQAISKANAHLIARFSARVRYKTWGVSSKHHRIKLQGVLPIGLDGKVSGKKKKIKLHRKLIKLKSRNSRFR
ncbi:hypothetical protein Tsubulata_027339 [Turnera subulata]|uniref:Late embryogenesis abundant protein LEA-2 subgroup domain-containing protein n=1 Tax=Turnera subulata TaxID=218843 RepID=A0A9Q0JGS1_9ROSI|nr:hypothetical protein Tsubulata_027339 [Turnera subulata]